MNPLSKMENFVLDIIRNGPVTGMTTDEIGKAQTITSYSYDNIRNSGLKLLRARGAVVAVGMRNRQVAYLDVERAGAAPHDQPMESRQNGDGRPYVQGEVSNLRRVLASYIEKVVAEDYGELDAHYLARCLLRDWDIEPKV